MIIKLPINHKLDKKWDKLYNKNYFLKKDRNVNINPKYYSFNINEELLENRPFYKLKKEITKDPDLVEFFNIEDIINE